MKRIMKSFLALAMFLGVFALTAPGADASTFKGRHTIWMPPVDSTLEVSTSGSSVLASITHWEDQYGDSIPIYFKMTLERYNAGSWSVIGTRYGYTSSISPSHREFTNVGGYGAYTKVKVLWYRDSARTQFCGMNEVKFYR